MLKGTQWCFHRYFFFLPYVALFEHLKNITGLFLVYYGFQFCILWIFWCVFCIFSLFYLLILFLFSPVFFSLKREKEGEGVELNIGRWGGSGRREGRGSQDQNILYVFLLICQWDKASQKPKSHPLKYTISSTN